MRKALGIALAIHLCLLLVAGYIYVLPPGKREALFRAVLRAEKIMPKKEVRTAPKKELKKAPAVRPLRRDRPIELIAVKRAISSEFTVQLPEISGAVYSPELALLPIPEPTVAERLPSFWERQIELKQREIRLESFGVTSLKPLGTPENPVTQIIFQVQQIHTAGIWEIGLSYPAQRRLFSGLTGLYTPPPSSIVLGPYPVPPEEWVFYTITRNEAGGIRRDLALSTDGAWCRRLIMGSNIIQYRWEESEPGSSGATGAEYFDDIWITITFMGVQ